MTTEQTKALAALKQRSKGGYSEVKKTEAGIAGGIDLPGGLRDAVAQITGADYKLDKNDNPGFILKATCIAPDEFKGAYAGLYYGHGADRYNSEEKNFENFVGEMKMLGQEVEAICETAEDESECVSGLLELFNDEKTEIQFTFNTRNRADKNGSFRVQLTGVPDDQGGKATPQKQTVAKTDAATGSKGGGTKAGSETSPFVEGQTVVTTGDPFGDGKEWEGTIQSINTDTQECSVLFPEDGDTADVSFDQLRIKPTEDAGMQVGDMVKTTGDPFGNGEIYTGEVTKIDGDNVTVKFEDGDIQELHTENVELDS